MSESSHVSLQKVEDTGLPVFTGESWDDHVSAWRQERQDLEDKQWRLGAIAASVVTKYGDKKMAKFASEVSTPTRTVYLYAQVFKQFENCNRLQNLSWTHHVTAMEASDPVAALEMAQQEELSVRELKQRINREVVRVDESPILPDNCRVVSDLDDLINEGELFGTIYADPPWRYGNQGTRAATDNHYDTMTVDEICALPVGQLADTRSHLWLWTTNGFLFECPKIFEAWGFEFKSSYVWVKPQIGIGNYLRNSHEFLLLAVRGGLTARAKDVRSWDEIERTEHSEKPEQVRTRVIERISPGPYLELFGRITRPGWTIFGNQVWNPAAQPALAAIGGPLFGGLQ